MSKPCYIFDLDGTLADLTHRLHHIQKKPKDWGAFFDAGPDDVLIDHIARLLNALIQANDIVICSGRPERCREDTARWFLKHRLDYHALYMRADGDYRADDLVKGELLDRILADGWQPIMAFDDRDRVVAMWRARGIPCAQVAEGDF